MAELFEPHDVMYVIAGVYTTLAVFISLYLIIQHLRHFTEPRFQKPIVRILLMVPIYAICSWFSLFLIKFSAVLDVFRDAYEAYALYEFFVLLTEFGGGEEHIISYLEAKEPLAHPWPLCCLPKMVLGRSFYLMCKRFVLQFVLVKPFLAVSAFVLALAGVYKEGCFYPYCGYLWVTIIDNISISFALYFLVIFYLSLSDEFSPYRPIPKFLCIKTVIFFSFWQGVLLSFLSFIGVIKEAQDWSVENVSLFIQDSTICIEMFFLAVAHAYAFGYDAYRDPAVGSLLEDVGTGRVGFVAPIVKNLGQVVSPKDVVNDTISTFSRRAPGSADSDLPSDSLAMRPLSLGIRSSELTDFSNENRKDAIGDSDL